MVHPEFAAMVADAVKAQNPNATQREIDLAVAGVAASESFRDLAHFMTRELAAGMYAQAIVTEAQKIATAVAKVGATTPTPTKLLAADEETWRKLNPAEKLARHYEAEAEERPDIESEARAQRIASNHATPMDALQHIRETEAPPTKAQRFAKENPQVRTDDLAAITDPVKRHAAYRGRVADTRSVERLKLDQAAYQRKALDPATPPSIRVAANLELSRIAERLKALNA